MRGDGCVVCVGDCLHDGEAEPDTARACAEPLERTEETLELRARDERAAVRDEENRAPRLDAGRHLDPAAGDVVPDRIRDEIGDESLDEVRIAGRPGRVERGDALDPDQVVSLERGSRDRGEVDRLGPLRPALAAGQGEAGLEHALLLHAGAEDVLADLAPGDHIRTWVAERQFEQRALRGERRTQLMGHVRGVEGELHGTDGRAAAAFPRRAGALSFESLCGVRTKIVCPREAARPESDENGVMRYRHEEALVVAAALLSAFVASHSHAARDVAGGTAVVLNILAILPLVMVRRWPTLAAAVSTFATVVILREYQAPLAIASFCVTLFLIATVVARRGLLVPAPLLLPFMVFAAARLQGGNNALASTAPLLFLVAALVVGESVRRRGLAVAALDESVRARVVMEERTRIARELHDIVAHHLSVIAVESEAARLTSPELSENAGGRLESIASTAREALTETRRLLGVLREDNGGKADRSPQPGLGELDDLIDKAQATGTPIRLVRVGKIARLSPGIDLAAYRIVQEALTNARRHAAGADVEVELSYGDDALRLRIRDHGQAVPGEIVAGHGLLGMRERAMLAGGTFSSGPAEGGGFEVDVTLPTVEAAL